MAMDKAGFMIKLTQGRDREGADEAERLPTTL